MNRREARKQAFILIFQYNFQPEETETLMNDFFDRNKAGGQRDYIEGAVRGVMKRRMRLMPLSKSTPKRWR